MCLLFLDVLPNSGGIAMILYGQYASECTQWTNSPSFCVLCGRCGRLYKPWKVPRLTVDQDVAGLPLRGTSQPSVSHPRGLSLQDQKALFQVDDLSVISSFP